MAKHTNIEIISSLIVSENGIQYKLNNKIYSIKYANNNWQLNNDGTNYYTIITTDNLNNYINLDDYYTKEETKSINDLLYYYNTDYIDGSFYTQTEINDLLNNTYYNKNYIDTNYYTKNEIDSKNYITSSVTDLTNFYNKTYINNNYYTSTIVDQKINEHVAGAFKFRGSVETVEDLDNIENPQNGDVYQVQDKEYAYNGSEWVELGFNIDIKQHIFYVDELPAQNIRVENSIYVLSGTNQTFVIDSNKQEYSISYEIVNTIDSSSTNAVVPGAKAVADYISVQNFITSSVTELTNFYNKTNVNQQLLDKVEFDINTEIPQQLEENKLYLTPNGQIAALIGGNPTNLSMEAITDLSQHIIDDDTIPTCKAVVDYITTQNYITSGITNLSNFYNKTYINNNYYTSTVVDQLINQKVAGAFKFCGTCLYSELANKEQIIGNVWQITDEDPEGNINCEYAYNGSEWVNLGYNIDLSNYALKNDLTNKIEFNINETLPYPSSNLSANVLYLTPSGEVAAVINDQLTNLSIEIITDLSQHITDDDTVPTCKSVTDYVSDVISNIDGKQHIFYVNELPIQTNIVENSVYVLSGTNQSFISDNDKNTYAMSYEVVKNINSLSTNDVIPGAKAVVDYVSGVISNIPTGDIQHIFYINSTELPLTTVSNSLYVLSGNQSIMIDNNNIEHNLSYKIDKVIDSTSTNNTIPGSKAVYDCINNISNTYIEIEYGVDREDCSWNNNLLTITYDVNTELPLVQIYITENNSYIPTNIPYTITKNSNSIIIDCTGYENKLISVKISK